MYYIKMTKDFQELQQKKSFANLTNFFWLIWVFLAEFGSDKKLSKKSDKKITKFPSKPWRKIQFSSLYNSVYLHKIRRYPLGEAFNERKNGEI